jgi:ORF73
MGEAMSALELFKRLVYPDPRVVKILINPSKKEELEHFIVSDLGADIENLLRETYEQYGDYDNVPHEPREDYMCIILSIICDSLELDTNEVMSSDIIPMQSKDIELPELGVIEPEPEEQPNYSDQDESEEGLYNNEESEVDESLDGGFPNDDEDNDHNNPDDDDEDSMPPFGDNDEARPNDEEMGGMPPFDDSDEQNNEGDDYNDSSADDDYKEPGEDDEPLFEDNNENLNNIFEDDKKEDEVVATAVEEVKPQATKSEPKPVLDRPKEQPKAETKVETKPQPKVVQVAKPQPQVEKIIEKVIIHNAPKREFRLYEETEDFLREIDEESVRDQDDIDINLLWNMLNDMYIWRRRVEKKVINIESRMPQVGTLDIGKMYKVFPDHIEIYKSSRLIKSIANRFVDFDQDTLATGLVNSTVQYDGKIWGVGISENINISREYAVYNFATNPETMEKVLREFIKGL